MNDLIQRLTEATGPSRALDWELYFIKKGGIEGIGMYGNHPPYTSSIDAALTLVPEGSGWKVQRNSRGTARCWATIQRYAVPEAVESHMDLYEEGDGATPALALCITALRARSSLTSPSGTEGGCD